MHVNKLRKVELAARLADAERELQQVQKAIQAGIVDRTAYLAARVAIGETQAQVWEYLRTRRTDPL